MNRVELISGRLRSFRPVEAPEVEDDGRKKAASYLLMTEENNPAVLFLTRSDAVKSHPGEICLPGGKTRGEDESLRATALRETFEETGIRRDQITHLCGLNALASKSGYLVHPFVGSVPPRCLVVPDGGEICDFFWIRCETLMSDAERQPKPRLADERRTARFPAGDGKTIWGLTAAIVVQFLSIAFAESGVFSGSPPPRS